MLVGIFLVISAAAAVGICGAWDGFFSVAWLWLLPAGFLGSFLGLILFAGLFLLFACAVVRTDTPQEKDSPFYRWMAGAYIEAILTLARVRVEVQGMEKMPEKGRFFLVCNHTELIDPPILLHVFRKYQLSFISKKENNQMPLVGKVMHKLMCQLIDRENDRQALRTIIKCIQLLKEDQVSVAVFPEGGIHPDRKFHHFRPGVFKIPMKANVPIVVCTMHNILQVIPNLLRLKPTIVEVHLLEVLPTEFFAEKNTTQLAEYIYEVMAKDLGPKNLPAEENT